MEFGVQQPHREKKRVPLDKVDLHNRYLRGSTSYNLRGHIAIEQGGCY